jgi:hypothetical protein
MALRFATTLVVVRDYTVARCMQGEIFRWDELGEEKEEGGCERFVVRYISCRGVRGGDSDIRRD